MKSIILFTFLIFCSFKFSYNQNWEHYFGDNDQYEQSRGLIESYDNGYLFAGRIYYETKDWINRSCLIKTDINGNMLWNKTFTNVNEAVFFNNLFNTIDGGVLLCGSISIGYNTYPLIVKLNACGGKEWCRRIPGAVEELPWAEDVLELPNGDIILLVNMFGEDPYETMHLFKIDADGNMLWQYPYCNGYEHDVLGALGENIQLTADNKIIICGKSYWKNPWEPGSDIYWVRPTFTKVDPETAEEEWVLPFGLQDTILGNSFHFIQTLDGNYLGFASDWTTENIHTLFIKFNASGNILDFKQIHPTYFNPTFVQAYFQDGFYIDSKLYLVGTCEIGPEEFPVFNIIEVFI